MKKIILFLISLTVATTLLADDNAFSDANKAYSEGNYESAIQLYEKLLQGDRQSATIYYNLGNAYYKKGSLASAILNYERAYRLSPSDKEIKANLAFANAQIADKIEVPKRYFLSKYLHGIIQGQDSNTWAYVALLFWAVLLLMFLLFLRTNSEQRRKLFFIVGILSLIIATFGFYSSYSQYDENHNQEHAIVFAQNITASSTPSDNGTELFILHEGTKVQIIDKVGEWFKIQLTDGREGWLPNKEIVKI